MLLRSNLTPSEMFQSCFGPENQWAVRQEDDEQGLFHSKPHPSSWPLFYSPRPRNVVHHFQSRCPYGRAFGFQTGFRTQNTWKVGYHRANNWPLYTLKTSPINGVYTSLDNPNEHFFTSVITELWREYETTQVVKTAGSSCSTHVNKLRQTSSKVLAKGQADSCYSGSRIRPFDHLLLFTQGPPCLRDHSFGILSLGIVAPLLLRTPNNVLTAHWAIPGCCSFYLIRAFHGY